MEIGKQGKGRPSHGPVSELPAGPADWTLLGPKVRSGETAVLWKKPQVSHKNRGSPALLTIRTSAGRDDSFRAKLAKRQRALRKWSDLRSLLLCTKRSLAGGTLSGGAFHV